jgi:hypothetical protein
MMIGAANSRPTTDQAFMHDLDFLPTRNEVLPTISATTTLNAG